MSTDRLEDIRQMYECRARYGWAWDTNDIDLYLTVYTDDAIVDPTAFGHAPRSGIADLKAMFEELRPGMGEVFHAYFPTSMVEFDGPDKAVGHSNFYAEAYFDGGQFKLRGAWRDEFVRTAAGWRIRHAIGQYRVPTEGTDGGLESE